jgi:mono/diheme cytochrome c family protein
MTKYGCCLLLLLSFGTIARAQDQAMIEGGEQVYADNCATCHGDRLRSTGAMPDLKGLGRGDRARFDKLVAEGRGAGMPAFQGTLSAEEIDQIWAYIRSRADGR